MYFIAKDLCKNCKPGYNPTMKRFSFTQARQNMIDNQLRPNKVTSTPLLQRFMDVPREEFSDSTYLHKAYADMLLPISENRTMFAPMTLARMIQSLDLTEDDNVLIVAGGTGYTAAIIAPLVHHVTLVEEEEYLLDVAQKEALEQNLNNITFKHAKPQQGAPDNSPYSRIIFDTAIQEIPQEILSQLENGGKISAVFTKSGDTKHATVFTKAGNTLFSNALFETKAQVLDDFKTKERFVF